MMMNSSGHGATYSKCRPDIFKFRTHQLLDIVSRIGMEVDIIIWQGVVDKLMEEELLARCSGHR